MMIYLSRHGEASPSGPDKPSSLTPKGRSEIARMAEYLIQKKNLKVSSIWHSPKTRAIQTAEIYWKLSGNTAIPMEEKINLSPDGDASQICREIIGRKDGNLLLVSHLPFLPDLAWLLLNESPGTSTLAFPTAGIAAFEFDKTFKLLWTLKPGTIQ